jgi:hypothetical protein
MKKIVFIALIAISASSCGKLTEGVVRNIDLPPHTPTLVGTLFADNSDTSLYAVISQTRGLLDSNASKLLPDAIINLYKNTVLQYSWNNQDAQTGYYPLHLGDTLGSYDGTYTFEVLHPDFDAITAADQFPPSAIITESILNKGAGQVFSFETDEIIVKLDDISGVDQHYLFSCMERSADFGVSQDTSWKRVELYTDDQRATQVGDGDAILLSENGIDADLQISLAPFSFLGSSTQEEYEYRLSVKTLSNEGLNYYRSISSYQNAQNNPFSEPVVIYSNVEGGYGVFALSRTVETILP